jgi:plastocyanin
VIKRKLHFTRTSLLVVAAAALALPPTCLAAAAPKVHTVIIDKMKFGPMPTGVRSGDTIVWVNKDFFKHTATARDRSFNLVLPPRTSGKTVIKHAGSIDVYCIYHPGMKAKLSVAR